MRTSLRLLAALFWSLGQLASAADQSSMSTLAFVQKYKDLYASEIKDASIFTHRLVARRTLRPFEVHKLEYDDSKNEIKIAIHASYNRYEEELKILESCSKTGSGVGTTAMGVKVAFTKEICHRVFLTMVNGLWRGLSDSISRHPLDWSAVVEGTSTQFRVLKEKGIDVQFTFIPSDSSNPLVKYQRVFRDATISFPFQQTIDNYYMPARIVRIEYFRVATKTPFWAKEFD